MKYGIIFENQQEFETMFPLSVIAETFADMSPIKFDDDNQIYQEKDSDNWYNNKRLLSLHQKIALKNAGVTKEMFNECKHLIPTAIYWVMDEGFPQKLPMDNDDLHQWTVLTCITNIIVNN